MTMLDNNRRIAQNTIYLYIRMIIVMFVSLYISRKVLEILGEENYGIYNVVGSFVGMLSFLNGSMSVATQRFLTYELGKGNLLQFRKVFSTSCLIHIVLAIIIFLLIESLGVWFLNEYLNIPSERLNAANWVLHASAFSMMIGIIQTPFNAAVIAHERMKIYAYVGILDVFLKLLSVFVLVCVSYDKLIIYALLLFGNQIILFLIYRIYCLRNFKECNILYVWNGKVFRSMLGFTSWNLFGTIAWILKDQGSNILLNIFGGPAINAARGISYQVSGAVRNMVSGFQTAVNPQITKTFAAGQKNEMYRLVFTSSKISFYLLLLVTIPILLETDFLLSLWLVEVPDYSVVFTRIILLEALIDALGGPLITSLMATGNIKWYQIIIGSILLLNLPVSYILLNLGFPIFTPFVVSLVLMFLALFGRLQFVYKLLFISKLEYVIAVLLPVVGTFLLSLLPQLLIFSYIGEGFTRCIWVVIVSVCSVFVFSYCVGFNKQEKELVRNQLVTWINTLKK